MNNSDNNRNQIIKEKYLQFIISAAISKEYHNWEIDEAIKIQDIIYSDDLLKNAVTNYTQALKIQEKKREIAIFKLYKAIEYIKNTGRINECEVFKKSDIKKAKEIMSNPKKKIEEGRHAGKMPLRNISKNELLFCFQTTRKLIEEYISMKT